METKETPFLMFDYVTMKIVRYATMAEARAVLANPLPTACVFPDGDRRLFFDLCSPQDLPSVRQWVASHTLKIRHAYVDGILLVKPTREDVRELKVGDLAPDCFGNVAPVVEIYAQRDDIHGRAFVCYYTRLGPTSKLSGSMHEGEYVPTIPATCKWHRTELYPDIAA